MLGDHGGNRRRVELQVYPHATLHAKLVQAKLEALGRESAVPDDVGLFLAHDSVANCNEETSARKRSVARAASDGRQPPLLGPGSIRARSSAPCDFVPVRLKPFLKDASDHAGHAPPVVVARRAAECVFQVLGQTHVQDRIALHGADCNTNG